jgi:hypothetical protein
MREETNSGQDPLAIDAERTIQEWEALYETPLECPSGARVVVTPPTLPIHVRAGRVPSELARLVTAVDPEEVLATMTVEAAEESLSYAHRMCAGVLRKPRAVEPNTDGSIRLLQKGEVDVRRIPNLDLFYITGWAQTYDAAREMNKVRRTEVTRADAENFRQDAELSPDGAHGEGVSSTGVESPEDQRSSVGA